MHKRQFLGIRGHQCPILLQHWDLGGVRAQGSRANPPSRAFVTVGWVGHVGGPDATPRHPLRVSSQTLA
eukprot:6209768-Pleurochrysis_carterae.AAC.2